MSNYLFADLDASHRSDVLNDLADRGRLGVKSGAGFYDYADGQGEAKRRRRPHHRGGRRRNKNGGEGGGSAPKSE